MLPNLRFVLSFVYGYITIYEVLGHRCPATQLELEEFQSATPYGNTSAGQYEKLGILPMDKCIYACCEMLKCNLVFIHDDICYIIKCVSEKYCEPLPREGTKFQNTYIVKVRPVQEYSILPEDEELSYDDRFLEVPVNHIDDDYLRKSGMMRRGGNSEIRSKTNDCTSSTDCHANEKCVLKNKQNMQRICECIKPYERDETGRCVSTSSITTTVSSTEALSFRDELHNFNQSSNPGTFLNVTTTPSTIATTTLRHLVVSAGDTKTVQLPEDAISLSAFAVPKESEGEHYKYEWTLVNHPAGDETGTMSDTNSATMKLSGLKEGVYTFKVTVSSDQAFGESFVNVTVLPLKRVNQAPIVAINPVNQTVKLPTTDTVLDGSASTDDDKIVSYAWEIVSAPMGYTPQLTETATLQLNSLIPGFYRFMLTVTDSDGVRNSTYANVTVIKEMDYPPTANAGSDVIIYLPQKEVTLNGTLSTDDKGIKSWEWTKGDGVNKAVDMQNTRTPFLSLSNLEVGMYTFILRVTDTADQTSTADVHVFVKPGNEGPLADAGQEQEIMLPLNYVSLDGSKSHDDVGISQWEWKQVNGPAPAKIENVDQPKTIVTELTKGVYVFQLTVYDDKKATSSKTVTITVKQSKNDPPRANAGGDRTIELPCNLIVLNGSASTDDVAVVSYAWKRDSTSLAAGEILEGSENSPLLMLTGLISGRYLFQLIVTDASGASSSDTASIIIKPASTAMQDVEICVAAEIYSFTEEQKVTISKKLALLLQDEGETVVKISRIYMEKDTNWVILVFHVEKIIPGGKIIIFEGPTVVHTLKKRLKLDSGLLNVPIIYISTVICQNNCSGHGICDQSTKQCVCEAFWMENLFRFYFGDKESNCDWSILYVIIILFVMLILCGAIIWGIICLCSCKQRKTILPITKLRLPRSRRKQRYSRLEANSDKEVMQMLPKGNHQNNSVMVSDSDLESDTLFEQKRESIGRLSNGFSKLPDEGGRSPQKVRT